MRTDSSSSKAPSSHSPTKNKIILVKQINVALYLRVSTDKQAEFGQSLDAQEAELRRYCHERGWNITRVYVDGGFSGKDTERPQYQEMIARIKRGGIDAIVVSKLDRLTRSIRNLCELNEDVLRELGVNLVCVRDGINTFEFGSTLLMHLLAVIGQIERENTASRVSAAIRHIHDQGGHYGKVPFGKALAPHPTNPKLKVLVDCPETGPWLKQINDWYAEGKYTTEIARRLNEAGVKPRYAERWNLHSVYDLLRKNKVLKKRSIDSELRYDREEAYKTAMDLREDGRTLGYIAKALTDKGLRPKNAAKYSISAVQDLLRGSIYFNTRTPEGLALSLRQKHVPLREICDRLLLAGHAAPRGGQWYPKTVSDLMKKALKADLEGTG